ncbi:hypothetical protein FYJ38_15750 [Clostridium sp. WB02_MRS01]|nr:hypothetical protein [Clostridium sp. WB02_MRS01]
MPSSKNRARDLELVIPFRLSPLSFFNNTCKKGGGKIYGEAGRFGRIAISSFIIVFRQAYKLGIVNAPFHTAIFHIIISINDGFDIYWLNFSSSL